MSARTWVAICDGCKTMNILSIQLQWARSCEVFSSCARQTKTFGIGSSTMWYRVLYYVRDGVIYVLHCFTKKTNKTPQGDIELARKRLSDLKQQLTKTKKH